MRGLAFKLALFGTVGLAGTAWASPPSAANSTVPQWIAVVGTQAAPSDPAPDPSGSFTIQVRDFANNPYRPGQDVEINFQACSDLRICQAVIAGQTVDCPNSALRTRTNALGQVTMTVLGAGINDGHLVPPAITSGAGRDCIRVYCNGVLLAYATAVIYDQNGALPGASNNGVNGADLAAVKSDIGAALLGAPYRGRSDYDHNGVINGADLGFFKDIVGRSALGNGSGSGCASSSGLASYCP